MRTALGVLVVLIVGAIALAVLDNALGITYPGTFQAIAHKVFYMAWGGYISFLGVKNKIER